MSSLSRRTLRVGRRLAGSVGARTYVPLVAELLGLALAAIALVALVAVTFALQVAVVLLVAPAVAGVWNWGRRWSPPRSRWRALAAIRRRRAELIDAIDRAPHRHARPRRPAHDLYGVFVESHETRVAVALVRRAPGPRRGRPERTTVVEERRFAGDDVEAAAAWLAELEERAAAVERRERDRLAAEHAERSRGTEDALLRAIEEAHEHELARGVSRLHEEDRRAREHEARLEAQALARALRRR